jgi:hypothetical protein
LKIDTVQVGSAQVGSSEIRTTKIPISCGIALEELNCIHKLSKHAKKAVFIIQFVF